MKTQGGLSIRDYSRASLSKAASLATSHATTGLAWPPVHCHKLGLGPTQLSHKRKATDRPQSAQSGAWTCSGPQILQMKTGRDTSFPNSQTSSPSFFSPPYGLHTPTGHSKHLFSCLPSLEWSSLGTGLSAPLSVLRTNSGVYWGLWSGYTVHSLLITQLHPRVTLLF